MTVSRILVGTDFSPTAAHALRSAEAVAEQLGGTIDVISAVERLSSHKVLNASFGMENLDELRIQNAERRMERLLSRVKSTRVAHKGLVRVGKAWEKILRAAEEIHAELICLGNSGRSRVERLLLGATAENVVRRARVPVLITRSRPLKNIRRVLVPVDFQEGSTAALQFVAERLPSNVAIDALFVIPPPVGIDPQMLNWVADLPRVEQDLQAYLARCGTAHATGEVHLFGDPADEILRRAERTRPDLIVISTHGRRGVARLFLGSVAEKVLRYSHRPALILPGPGRARPASP